MQIEGHLSIQIRRVRGQANDVRLRSTRPVQASKALVGRSPAQAAAALRLLFSVCGMAQSAAGVLAMQQAMGLETSGEAARQRLVLVETAREHLWRVLIDWPKLCDEPPDTRAGAELGTLMSGLEQALFPAGGAFSLETVTDPDDDLVSPWIDRLERLLAASVFGRTPSAWLEIDSVRAFDAWAGDASSSAARFIGTVCGRGWRSLGAVETRFLPDTAPSELNRLLEAAGADRFLSRPTWREGPCETSPLARQSGHPLVRSLSREYGSGLLTRTAARLVEVAAIPAAMRASARQPDARPAGELPQGVGIGQLEAARGRLVHRVVLNAGSIARYQILAPTEWNFHPEGVVVQALRGLGTGDGRGLRRQAALFIAAVDPCVAYDLEVC